MKITTLLKSLFVTALLCFLLQPSSMAQSYTIVSIKNPSIGLLNRRVYNIALPPTIKRSQIKPILEKLVAKVTSSNRDIDEIGVFLYSDVAAAKRGISDIGRADWAPGGVWGTTTDEVAVSNNRTGYKLSIVIRRDLESFLKSRNSKETKLGLSDTTRREIYNALYEASDRARAETDATYPTTSLENMRRNNAMNDRLTQEYRAAVMKRYNITDKQKKAILNEGGDKNW